MFPKRKTGTQKVAQERVFFFFSAHLPLSLQNQCLNLQFGKSLILLNIHIQVGLSDKIQESN